MKCNNEVKLINPYKIICAYKIIMSPAKTRSGSVLTGLIPPPPAAINSSFFKSRSKSRSRPLGQKYWYQQKGLVTRNLDVCNI